MKIKYAEDSSGNKSLSDQTFKRVELDDLEILPPPGHWVKIERCSFLNCSTSPGTCIIGEGALLDDVVFENFACGDALRIDSKVALKNVVVKGRRPSALIIQPIYGTEWEGPGLQRREFQLDIRDFKGTVVAVGLPGDRVLKDTSRHVTIRACWKDEVDWRGLNIGPASYWRIFLGKLLAFKADEGVFSLPKTSDPDYSEAMRELEALQKSGISFA